MVFEVLDRLMTSGWLLQCVLVSEYHIIPHKHISYVSVKKNMKLFKKCRVFSCILDLLDLESLEWRNPGLFIFNTETQEPVLCVYARPQKPVHTEGLVLPVPQRSANQSHWGIFSPRPGYKTEKHYTLFQPWCGRSKKLSFPQVGRTCFPKGKYFVLTESSSLFLSLLFASF